MTRFNPKSFISGLIIGGMLCSGITLYAASEIKESYFNNEIKVQNNGTDTGLKVVTVVTDDNSDGSSYLPLRKTAELLGKDIQWDGTTNTANITDKKEGDTVSSTMNELPKVTTIDGLNAYSYNGKVYIHPLSLMEQLNKPQYWFQWKESENRLYFKSDKGEINSVPFIIIQDRMLVEYDYIKANIIPIL